MAFLFRYGTVFALVILCVFFTLMTFNEQFPTGSAAGDQVAAAVHSQFDQSPSILLVARNTQEDSQFLKSLESQIGDSGARIIGQNRLSGHDFDAVVLEVDGQHDIGHRLKNRS